MSKELPTAKQLRLMAINNIAIRDAQCQENLMNSINQVLMEAAEQGCNAIRLHYKTIKDNAKDIQMLTDYYTNMGYKVMKNKVMKNKDEFLDISFSEKDDSEKLWLGNRASEGPHVSDEYFKSKS